MKRNTRSGGSKAGGATHPKDALPMRHLRFGWWSLFIFLLLGLVLEALHGFKVGWYLEIANTPRRFSWTLAHAHGTLLAVINLIFGGTMHRLPSGSPRARWFASVCLLSATVILPGGFFLGGLIPYQGDPGIGIFLVPVGGALLAIAVFLIALSCRTPGEN